MQALDQEARLSLFEKNRKPKRKDFEPIEKMDRLHTKKLKTIIKNIGWPTIPKVGKMASLSAWLLAQHADHDIKFQKHCLKLMNSSKKNIEKFEIAYLEDRILTKETGEQLYGTQIKGNELFPIKDRVNLRKRREEFELAPLSDYLKLFKNKAGKKRGVSIIEKYY